MIFFETERLLFQSITEKEILDLLEIYRDTEVMRFIPNSKILWKKENLSEKYEKTNVNYDLGFGIFAVICKENKQLIGEAGFFNSFENLRQLELGYILKSDCWGKGFGTEICKGLIEYGFSKLNLQKMVARMYQENLASEQVSKKCGMTKVKEGRDLNGDLFVQYEINS
ncbi:GNAT family N-acetyltransferase [Labilibaculum sp.]|uniref:GNAT family N-acetyltransferase n=1 Tax=Labilibaculum sp. TaxID=2060723 RepID=UPI00356B207B